MKRTLQITSGLWLYGPVLLFLTVCLSQSQSRGAEQRDKSAGDKASESTREIKSTREETSPAASGKPERKPVTSPPKSGNERPAKESQSNDYTPEREAAALTFAALQHPELTNLIGPLKETNPKEYERAIRELFRTSERLALIREKSPERYDIELEAWKFGSRIRVLAARLSMARDPALEQEVRELLAKQLDARVQLMLLDREDLEQRLKKLESQIKTAQDVRDKQVEKDFEKVLRSVTSSRPAVSDPVKKGSNPPKKGAVKKGPAPKNTLPQSSPPKSPEEETPTGKQEGKVSP